MSEQTPNCVLYLTHRARITRTMGREINLDTILAMDAEIIRLKRTRNSLLNIANIPSEILGYIFSFNVMGTGDPCFPEVQKGSHNFLFVCHHWFQVALHTPDLWNSWGSDPKDWKQRYLRSGTSALDLVLDTRNCKDRYFDGPLRDALRDRAARGVIRKVHLRSNNTKLLTAIVSSLIPEGESVRRSSIESIALSNVDISDLFARHYFPKLRALYLSGSFQISSWDHLISSTATLTNISLSFADITPSSAVPIKSQILSLLAWNPNIRSLTLSQLVINDDGGDGPRLHPQLCRLEDFSLTGAFRHVFPILRQLEFSERIDNGQIALHDCTSEEVVEVIGPYIREYLRRDVRFKDRLRLFVFSTPHCISFHVSVVGIGYHGSNRLPKRAPPYGMFRAMLSQPIPPDAMRKLRIDFLALLPRESIVEFGTGLAVTEGIVAAMPNLEILHLYRPVVHDGFLLPEPNGPNAHKKLFPSLRWLHLDYVQTEDNNWDPLITFLTHQTSGGQTVSLNVFGNRLHICSHVIKQIEGLVEELIYQPDPNGICPLVNECL